MLILLIGTTTSVNSFNLVSIEREVLKQGLHRDIKTKIVYDTTSSEEQKCSLVFREKQSTDIYVYLEEVLALHSFEFWPAIA